MLFAEYHMVYGSFTIWYMYLLPYGICVFYYMVIYPFTIGYDNEKG